MFLFFLFVGIIISCLPRLDKIFYQTTKVLLCCCIFPFYYFGTRETHDINVFQSLLNSISTLSVYKTLESIQYEPISMTSLWLFKDFDNGAFIWHSSIVLLFFLSIINFVETVVGKNIWIPTISFIAVLPALFGEFILNQSRQLLSTAWIIICLSFVVIYIRNLTVQRQNLKFNWKNLVIAFIFGTLSFLSHYSSISLITLIVLFIFVLQLFISDSPTLMQKLVKITFYTILTIGFFYFVYSLSTSFSFMRLSLYETISRYSNYEYALNTYNFVFESKNVILIQVLFFFDFLMLIINRKNTTYSNLSKELFSLNLVIFLYFIGSIGYAICYYSIHTPGLIELGRRFVYYVFTIQVLAFSVSMTQIKKFLLFIVFTSPFILYTVIMIVFSPHLFKF
jgi:hypothetical protein